MRKYSKSFFYSNSWGLLLIDTFHLHNISFLGVNRLLVYLNFELKQCAPSKKLFSFSEFAKIELEKEKLNITKHIVHELGGWEAV